eukprot:14253278-Heterocapsa_arctica.AAC.4
MRGLVEDLAVFPAADLRGVVLAEGGDGERQRGGRLPARGGVKRLPAVRGLRPLRRERAHGRTPMCRGGEGAVHAAQRTLHEDLRQQGLPMPVRGPRAEDRADVLGVVLAEERHGRRDLRARRVEAHPARARSERPE